MSDDHLPAPGQFCSECGEPDHLWCIPVDNEALAQLFTEMHNAVPR